MRSVFALAGVLAASAMPASVHAAPLNFDITGAYTANFSLDSSPKPNFVDGGYRFNLYDVKGSFPGASTPVVDLIFYSNLFEGGLAIEDFSADFNALLVTTGPQIYGGSEAAPIFQPGTFQLNDLYNSNSYTLTISDLNVSAVPEPAAWAMMVFGFGIAGAAMRRRPRAVTA